MNMWKEEQGMQRATVASTPPNKRRSIDQIRHETESPPKTPRNCYDKSPGFPTTGNSTPDSRSPVKLPRRITRSMSKNPFSPGKLIERASRNNPNESPDERFLYENSNTGDDSDEEAQEDNPLGITDNIDQVKQSTEL